MSLVPTQNTGGNIEISQMKARSETVNKGQMIAAPAALYQLNILWAAPYYNKIKYYPRLQKKVITAKKNSPE